MCTQAQIMKTVRKDTTPDSVSERCPKCKEPTRPAAPVAGKKPERWCEPCAEYFPAGRDG